jgi:hypothetical protein
MQKFIHYVQLHDTNNMWGRIRGAQVSLEDPQAG